MNTQQSLSASKERRMRLVEVFASFGPAYLKWMQSQVRGSDLTYARMRLLNVLQCHGPQIMSGLSEELGVTPRNITTLVDALEEDALVRRRPHPTDRRATFIELTPQGMQTCRGAYDEHVAAVSELFAGLSDEDQSDLLRIMEALRAALQRRGVIDGPHEGSG